MTRWRHVMANLAAALVALASPLAWGHSASDAYLTLAVAPGSATVIEGQWDIALRDLNFVLKLDADGDGAITWGEVKRRQSDIERYAYANLAATMGGRRCAIEPQRQQVTDHADGAYAALFFRMACKDKGPKLALDYRLFFAVDPSHRGILVLRNGAAMATSLLSPENARVSLDLRGAGRP